jgi:phenylalanyl-tRNA synthetase alpha chain
MGIARLEEVRAAFLADLESAGGSAEAIEAVRVRYAGRRSGLLQDLTAALRELPNEEKRAYGQALNELKKLVAAKLDEAKASGGGAASSAARVDVTLPGTPVPRGAQHPVHLVRQRIETIFLRMGYDVEDGPEVEDDWHNFEALNIPPDHPARDDQDTFYLPGGLLLRTHTSPVQARTMEVRKPPIRIIVPGRVYRRRFRPPALAHVPPDRGLLVDEGVTFGHLKATLETFLHALFAEHGVDVRFRPSYFPFTEPSAEVDITCIFCGGEGCAVCSRSGWIEILGSGMVDPRVFAGVGIDPERYTGFAFGLGLDRVAMLTYGIPDLRQLFAGDPRLTRQFA